MAQSITLWGATYSNVPAVNLPKSTSGTARFTDTTPTTAVESDVANGKVFFKSDGSQAIGTASGGGGSGLQIDTIYMQSSQTSSSLTFTGLKGEPTSFAVMIDDSITPSAQSAVAVVVFDGTSLHGQTITNTTNAQVTYDGSSFSKSYSNGTLTITSSGASFKTVEHALVYSYGGGSIDTKDVQVGSGATSITFTGLEDEPVYWTCIFKSNFGSSSGYQRVIYVENKKSSTVGIAMDSSTHGSNSYWTSSYSNGSLTITSQGTNAGGYFHQPGYYQLTYAYDDGSGGNYQTKNKAYTPTTSQQTETIQADTGYDALKKVNITVNAIPSEYIIPSGNLAITQNGNNINVAQYATVSVTVSGGGSSTCDTKTITNSDDQATSIEFTGLSGQPKWFFVRCTSQLSRSSSYSYYYVTAVRYNGTNHYGNYYRRSNGTFYNDTAHYSHTYSNGTLTVSSSANRGAAGGSFYSGGYELVYIY